MTASTTTGQGRVRVLVVDDHPVVRAGMVALLSESPDIDIVAEAADGAQALVAVSQHAVDVVLMDLRMPVMDGAAATADRRAP
jgi:DNA-binding NarL/FixJ family response regulator